MSQQIVAMTVLAFALAAPMQPPPSPMPGQIVIDWQNPQWLKRQGGKHVFICGPGDPEDFLYRGKRNPNGSRDGDQVALINKLIKHGGNCIYMQIVRSHGGDGQRDHNPFVDSDPKKGLDEDILKQWDSWLSLMDRNNILIYLFFYDDGAKIWRTGNRVGAEEKRFVETIVRRFQRFKNLIWIIAEESEEAYSTKRVHAIANTIGNADKHGHIIGNHHQSSVAFKSWKKGGALTHYAMQLTRAGAAAHHGALEAFRKAQGKYQVIYSESTAAKPDAKHAWHCAMGGLMPMMLKMDIAATPVKTLNQCRYLQQFFEATDFYKMFPHDELAHANAQWVLANPPHSYIAYAENAKGQLGIKNMQAGTYTLTWLNCATGTQKVQRRRFGSGDQTLGVSPVGPWCAVWVRRADPG